MKHGLKIRVPIECSGCLNFGKTMSEERSPKGHNPAPFLPRKHEKAKHIWVAT